MRYVAPPGREGDADRDDATADRRAAAAANNEFIARMSHQMRTPLSAVLGFGQLLEMEPLDPTAADYARQIARGGRLLFELLEAVRDFSDLEAGVVTPSLYPVGLAGAVREAVGLVEHRAAARDISITVAPFGEDVQVVADAEMLRRVLMHLLTNAVSYNRDGGTVTVATSPSEEGMRLVVSDTGEGLGDEDLVLAFAPFERLRATERGIEGAGFGLTSSRLLAELMGGQLTATSNVGVGSSFALDLRR
jgi:signal transduction histidine kinase